MAFPTRFHFFFFIFAIIKLLTVWANEDAKRLYYDLLVNYNRHRRPSPSPLEPITIKLKLRLSQIIDVHEIDQIMTCSVWLAQVWMDSKLKWNPEKYGGVSVLYVPHEMIWTPDIVLYNNADSNYNITISTKATLQHTGEVRWEPPAIFKSLCQMDVRWFPFDEQECYLKFGSWSYPEKLLNLELINNDSTIAEFRDEYGQLQNSTVIMDGIDLSDYYPSVEWDIMSRMARRRAKTYAGCCPTTEQYVDIMYFLVLRRKPLFYTVNLVFPCVGISFLTIMVFYLPSDSGEKISLCISILVALEFFYLLLTEIIPATSISLPLIGKYLLFTMIMVTLSVLITVIYGKKVQLSYEDRRISRELDSILTHELMDERLRKLYYSPIIVKAFENICFIAELLKKKDRDVKVEEDWKYVAMVLDRFFLIIFSLSCIFGTIFIFVQAPSFYDGKKPIDLQYRPNGSIFFT